jgi:hypothetical protein
MVDGMILRAMSERWKILRPKFKSRDQEDTFFPLVGKTLLTLYLHFPFDGK